MKRWNVHLPILGMICLLALTGCGGQKPVGSVEQASPSPLSPEEEQHIAALAEVEDGWRESYDYYLELNEEPHLSFEAYLPEAMASYYVISFNTYIAEQRPLDENYEAYSLEDYIRDAHPLSWEVLMKISGANWKEYLERDSFFYAYSST